MCSSLAPCAGETLLTENTLSFVRGLFAGAYGTWWYDCSYPGISYRK